MSTNQERVDHGLEAELQVMRQEVAWFGRLDIETVMRIAVSAAPDSLEYRYATAELKRRTQANSGRVG